MTPRAIIHEKFSSILKRGPVHDVCVCMVKMSLPPAAKTLNESGTKKSTRARDFKFFMGYSVTLVGTSFVFPIEVYQGINMK